MRTELEILSDILYHKEMKNKCIKNQQYSEAYHLRNCEYKYVEELINLLKLDITLNHDKHGNYRWDPGDLRKIREYYKLNMDSEFPTLELIRDIKLKEILEQ
jgi:hypothetical protein